MRKFGAWPALLLALAGAFLAREADRPPLSGMEAGWVDWLAALSERPEPGRGCVLVEIDDASLASQTAWPWPPMEYALFLKALHEQRPAVTAIEPVLRWEDESETAYFKILVQLALRTQRLLLAAGLSPAHPEGEDAPRPVPGLNVLTDVRGDAGSLVDLRSPTEIPDLGLAEVATAGALPPAVDPQGPLRRVPLVARYRGDAIPTLPLQACMLREAILPAEVRVEPGRSIRLGAGREIPIDPQGCIRVDARAVRSIDRIPLDEFLLSIEERRSGLEPTHDLAGLDGRVVLLGLARKSDRTIGLPGDLHVTRAELLAATINSLDEVKPPRRAGWWLDLALIALVVLVASASSRWSRGGTLSVWIVLLGLYALGSANLYAAEAIWTPFLLPAGLGALACLLRFFRVGRSRVTPGQTAA